MHILHLPSEYPTKDHKLGGIFTKELISQLPKKFKIRTIYIYLFSAKKVFSSLFLKSFKKYESKKNINIKYFPRFPLIKLFNYFSYYYNFKLVFSDYINKYGKPDLIHAHFSEFSSYAAYKTKKEFNIPYFITEHSTDFLDGKFLKNYKKNSLKSLLIKKIFINSKHIICVSNQLKKSICKFSPNLKKKIKVIPNTILYVKPNLDIKKTYDFIFVGTFEKRKIPFLVLKAFKDLIKDKNKFILCLIGSGPLEKDMIRYIKKNKLEKNIKFFSNLRRKEVIKKISQSKILLSSSLFETFGVVLIEAYSQGVPVLITDSIGVRDVFVKGCGRLLTNFSVKNYSVNMLEMINNLDNYKKNKIIKVFKNNYQSKIVIRKHTNLYKI